MNMCLLALNLFVVKIVKRTVAVTFKQKVDNLLMHDVQRGWQGSGRDRQSKPLVKLSVF